MENKHLNSALPYTHKILQFCSSHEPFNLLHVLNMSDLSGTLVSQGLQMLKEVHNILVIENNYATCIQQEFPRPTWYTLNDEGRMLQQAILSHPPLQGILENPTEAFAVEESMELNSSGLN
ncbi:hypothetical protein BH10BAC2_BH10BAC2_33550 [soil metagenome]